MAKRAVRANLSGEAARANVWEVEKRERPFLALPRLPASHVPELCWYMSSPLVLATTDQETGIREPAPPAQGHTAGPGVESRAAWPAEPYSFFWPTRLSWGQGLLETCKEWARLCLCLAERRNQLPTLRPTASSFQPDQRPTGFSCPFLPWPLGSLTRHAHSHHLHHHHQGRAAAPGTAQGAWGTQGAL